MAPISMDVAAGLRKRLAETDPDLLREVIATMVQALMAAEVDGICGAGYGEISPERVNSRNGYRLRPWDTRAGSIALPIPKLREGTDFPAWLLQPRRRAERALVAVVAVVAVAYLLGVSTRRVEGLVQAMGITAISKSQVSAMAGSLDPLVRAFRDRPMGRGPSRSVWIDALTQRCREEGRIVYVAPAIASGVNAEGHREILGVDVFTAEDGAAWTAFLRGRTARGLTGVQPVIADAQEGLKAAIAAVLPGTTWQRCRVHWADLRIRPMWQGMPRRAAGNGLARSA